MASSPKASGATSQRLIETAPQSQRGDRKPETFANTERVGGRRPQSSARTYKDPVSTRNSERERPKPPVKTATTSSYAPDEKKSSGKQPEVWVKKWVDYSSKYGLGYILSNGSIGVFFNDSTKIVLEPTGQSFNYIERRGPEKIDIANTHTLTEYPKDLQKKVTLLQHFRSYLEGDKNETANAEDAGSEKTNPVYVKKWMRTRHAIMFRLSNKVVQVNFQDSTEIILCSESRVVTYVNKKGERNTYPLVSALESSNTEMTKRLKYTKDILTHMLNNHGGTTGSTASPLTSTNRRSK